MNVTDGLISLFSPRRRASVSSSRDLADYLQRSLESTTGASVNETSALRVGAVYGCVRILSESIASLPLHVYRRLSGGGQEKAVDHPLYRILHSQANAFQSSYEWRETAMIHLLLRGNHVSVPLVVDGEISELIPILPDLVEIKRIPGTGELIYEISPELGAHPVPFRKEEVFHLKGLSSNGWCGRSVLSDAREAFGMGIAEQEFAGRFFSNRANHGMVVIHPGTISDTALIRLRESLESRTTQLGNAWKTLLLEEDMKLQTISMTLEDAQFIEGRQFTVTDICRFFGVPPHMVYELSRATFSNVEQMSLDFAIYAVRPKLVRFEQAANMQLIGVSSDYFSEFNMEAMLRADSKSQADALAIEVMNGMITLDEIRAMKNRTPYDEPWSKKPWMSANLIQPGVLRNGAADGNQRVTG